MAYATKSKWAIALIGLILLGAITITHADESEFDSLSVVESYVMNETIHSDGTVVEVDEVTTLVKSQLAVDTESHTDLPYNSTLANLEVLEAYMITPTGEKIEVAQNAIRTVEDDNSSGAAMFSDQKHKIIIFPKVTPGSRTYYKSKLTTHTPLMPGYFYTKLVFSPNVEVLSYKYSLKYPQTLKLYTDTKGVQEVKDQTVDDERHVEYFYQNLKKTKKEYLQVSANDFGSHLYISTLPSQEAFAKAYEERMQGKTDVTPQVQQLADEITAGIPKEDKKAQARALYNWVSHNIRYVAIYLGDGGIIPHDANSIIQNQYGDCKDHNALLIALLAAKGIDSSSALINSGTTYTLPIYPVISPFNHVITYIPQWDLYLDSTAEMAPYGSLVYYEVDKPTLITKLAKIGRTPKVSSKDNRTVTSVTLNILPDGQIKGKAHTQFIGGADVLARYAYEGVGTSLSEGLVKNQLSKFRQTGDGSLKTSMVYDLNEPFTTDSEFTLDAVANIPGPGAMTIPVGLAPGELVLIANERPPEKFTVPYTCATRSVSESYKIEFPSNVKLTRIPNDVTYNKDGIEYKATYRQSKNNFSVVRDLSIQRPGAVCEPEELQRWKNFYQVFIKDMRGQIFYE